MLQIGKDTLDVQAFLERRDVAVCTLLCVAVITYFMAGLEFSWQLPLAFILLMIPFLTRRMKLRVVGFVVTFVLSTQLVLWGWGVSSDDGGYGLYVILFWPICTALLVAVHRLEFLKQKRNARIFFYLLTALLLVAPMAYRGILLSAG